MNPKTTAPAFDAFLTLKLVIRKKEPLTKARIKTIHNPLNSVKTFANDGDIMHFTLDFF